MATTDVAIRLQVLDGTWEEAGKDRFPNVVPESVVTNYNEWGPDTASFILRRRPGDLQVDLSAFTPVEIEIGGVVVWTGRTKEAPTKEGADAQISVQCEGWQYHLDDDTFRKTYVHARVADYQDMRTFPNAILGANHVLAAGQVSNDSGVIQLSFPNGTGVVTGSTVGVALDLGPTSLAKRIVVAWECNVTDANFTFFLRAAATPDETSWGYGQDAATPTLVPGPTTTAGTFSTSQRYVQLFIYRGGGAGTLANDVTVKLKSVQVFAATAYESGNASILKASDLVQDIPTQAVLSNLSSDLTRVATTAFNIPEYTMADDATPREQIQAVNAYHDYRTMVDVNKRLVFDPKPSAPVLELGPWAGAEFEDASANSGEGLYNRAIVEGTAADGSTKRIARTSTDIASAQGYFSAAQQPTNPTFAANTTGWTTTGSVITRDTGTFDTTPASGRWDKTGAADALTGGETLSGSLSGTFNQGVNYVLSFKVKNAGPGNMTLLCIFGGSGGDNGEILPILFGSTSWQTLSISWTPATTTSSAVFALLSNGGSYAWIDSILVIQGRSSLLDRRRFRRTKLLPVSFGVTDTTGQQIADIFLKQATQTPFKGAVNHTDPQGVKKVLGGEAVPPHEAGLYMGELLRVNYLTDPDTGGLGRDGRLASVSYTHASRSASISLDNQRQNFETFLSRLGLVTGVATQAT